MKVLRISIISLIVFCIFNFSAFSNPLIEVPKEILIALKSGNSKELAKFFNSNIELEIFGDEEVYSKAQAELIIKDFFSKHSPSGFSKLHEGGKDGSKYVIGNLSTSTGTYRVYFLLKDKGGKAYIHELRIEDE